MIKIPNGWCVSCLGSVAKCLDGQRIPVKESERAKIHGQYPYYGASGIIDYVNDYIFDDDLILLGEDGANILDRSSPLAYRVTGKVWVNNHAHVYKPNLDMDIVYLIELLESLDYHKFNTGSAQPKLNQDVCSQIPVFKPPLHEQQKIGHVASVWDRGVVSINQQVQLCRIRRNGLMQQLLTDKRRIRGHRDPWKSVHLGDIFLERSENGRTDLPLLSITGEGGVVPRCEDRKDTSSEDKSKYIHICPGDIGYNTMRMWQGVCGLSRYEGILSPAYTVVTPGPKIDGEFAAIFFKFPPVINLFRRHSQGLVDDTLNLKFHHFAQIKVTIPPIDEQRAIAKIIAKADSEISVLERLSDAYREQKKGLMQQLLTGKRRVSISKTSSSSSAPTSVHPPRTTS